MSFQSSTPGVIVNSQVTSIERVLTPAAMEFLAKLHRRFDATRLELLAARVQRQRQLDGGERLDFLASTKSVREANWRVAKCPSDLLDRRVEITGPVERKMMINALNSGASAFMADFEDALSPTWENAIHGQINVMDSVHKTIELKDPSGKHYKLNPKIATLLIRPRGWHLWEKNFQVDGRPMSASLFDFGLCFFHNAAEQLKRESGPYFYLPKMESHREARLWNDVFTFAQKELGIAHGSVRVTVLIETIPAAFEMDEILYELKDHISGLNAGRWDYIFSMIKKHCRNGEMILPDRGQVTMAVPFMSAYANLLVRTCHRRGAHAMGGMAAFVPSRKDEVVNANAFAKVREDKEREVKAGFDGTWVAHPDLVPVAKAVFDAALKDQPNQKQLMRDDVKPDARALLDVKISGGKITEAGVRGNIGVSLQYIYYWLKGLGAVALHNLMEDAATAEISRAQLWQWRTFAAKTDSGQVIDAAYYRKIRQEETAKLGDLESVTLKRAGDVLDRLVLDAEFHDFLTSMSYEFLS